jgi:hypothetical protein
MTLETLNFGFVVVLRGIGPSLPRSSDDTTGEGGGSLDDLIEVAM